MSYGYEELKGRFDAELLQRPQESKFTANKDYVTLKDESTKEFKHIGKVDETIRHLKGSATVSTSAASVALVRSSSVLSNRSSSSAGSNGDGGGSGLVVDASKAPLSAGLHISYGVDEITDFVFTSVWKGDIGRTIEYLDGGIDVNVCDRYGMTALHWTAQYGRIDTMKHLLSLKGINQNIRDINNRTPIMLAVMNNQLDCVQELLLFGCNTKLRNEEGMSPLDKARQLNYLDIAKCIEHFNKLTPWIEPLVDVGIDKTDARKRRVIKDSRR